MEGFFNYIQEWLNSGQYGFFTDFAAYLVESMVLGYLKFMAVAIPFAWGIAKNILEDLNLSTYLADAWSDIPLSARQILAFFKVPEAINTILSGFATRFVLRFIPGL